MPKILKGSEPADGGYLFLSKQEREEFLQKNPTLSGIIHPFIGGKEFLQDKIGMFSRYCFWLKGISPSVYKSNQDIMERLRNIKELRMKSSADRIRKRSDYPYLFCQDRQPTSVYLAFPQHTTANRKYIPIGYMNPDVIVGNACYVIPNLSIYHFGILISNVHMAWMRAVCGRLGIGYRYSPAIYNNFPWPTPTDAQKAQIEQTAQAILDARALYPDCSLADLYDEITMPTELRKAHQQNDRAVMQAYGFDVKTTTETSCVAELMKMYQKLTERTKNIR